MEVLSHNAPMIKQTIQTFPWRYYLKYPHDQTNNTNTSMEVLSHSTPHDQTNNKNISMEGIISYYPHDQTNNTNISMEILSHSTPHDQTNNTHTSTDVLFHSTPMIKQTIQTFPWRYYLTIPP